MLIKAWINILFVGNGQVSRLQYYQGGGGSLNSKVKLTHCEKAMKLVVYT